MNQAELYQRSNGLQRRDAKQVLDEFSHLFQWRLDGEDTLLDIGCGSGDVTIDYILPLLPKGFKTLIGTDLSDQMVNYARDMYALPNVNFEKFDICCDNLKWNEYNNDDDNNNNNNNNTNIGNKNDTNQIPILIENIDLEIHDVYTNQNKLNKNLDKRNIFCKHQTFDHITSFYCLHWVENQRQAVKNIYNLLDSDGGDCLLAFLANNPIFQIYQQLADCKKWQKYMYDVHKYISPYQYSENPAKDFANILYASGFTEYSVEVRDKVFIYEGLNILKKSVQAVNPFLNRMPFELHEEFLDDYVDVVTKMQLTEFDLERNDFRFITPYKLMIAYARK